MMQTNWKDVKNILCIRLDNMGDLLMSTPAFSALKMSLDCKLSVLTSTAAAAIAREIPEIDQVFIYDAPWVKQNNITTPDDYTEIVKTLSSQHFDAAIIFTVYSQNPLPSAMLAWQAGIPVRLAYCRENPYQLLTHWIPDEEPFKKELHQVERDLELVAVTGANFPRLRLSLQTNDVHWASVTKKIRQHGGDPHEPWIILHAMVQDEKRRYSFSKWVEIAKQVVDIYGYQLLITGNQQEAQAAEKLKEAIGEKAINVAGIFSVAELALLIRKSRLVVSVNTGVIHIAAATSTPIVVLYAITNLQHTPWNVRHEVLYFDVPDALQSKNQLLQYAYKKIAKEKLKPATVENVLQAIDNILQ